MDNLSSTDTKDTFNLSLQLLDVFSESYPLPPDYVLGLALKSPEAALRLHEGIPNFFSKKTNYCVQEAALKNPEAALRLYEELPVLFSGETEWQIVVAAIENPEGALALNEKSLHFLEGGSSLGEVFSRQQ